MLACVQGDSDNEVLDRFPRAVRDRVLRALYLPPLQNVYLFNTPRIQGNPAFISNLLSLGQIDTYVPNVAVLEANTQVHEFMILLDGEIRVPILLFSPKTPKLAFCLACSGKSWHMAHRLEIIERTVLLSLEEAETVHRCISTAGAPVDLLRLLFLLTATEVPKYI